MGKNIVIWLKILWKWFPGVGLGHFIIGSDNGLRWSGNGPLSEQMTTKFIDV